MRCVRQIILNVRVIRHIQIAIVVELLFRLTDDIRRGDMFDVTQIEIRCSVEDVHRLIHMVNVDDDIAELLHLLKELGHTPMRHHIIIMPQCRYARAVARCRFSLLAIFPMQHDHARE